MITVENLLFFAKQHIHSDHAKILISELLNCNPLELLNHLHEIVPDEKVLLLKKEIKALKENKPLQYVLGHINFYGLDFIIDDRVLIPRFETEELVENTIKYVNKYFKEPVDIIDLGCGSGVIGLTLEKKVTTKSVDLIDISKKALEVAKINCQKLQSKAKVIENDMLENIDKKYDIIISNPPYIKTTEQIEDIVKNNEPHIALYAGEDGLDYYRKILKSVSKNLKKRTLIAFEIGMSQANDIKQLANKYLLNPTIEVKKDLSEKDRMIFILIEKDEIS